MPRPRPIPLTPRHRRDWRTWWRRCGCGCAWPCPDRLLPAPVEPATVPAAYRKRADVPAESAVWAVSGVTDELREVYVNVGAALVLLERFAGGPEHPALHPARRCVDHALHLADEAERLLGLGIHRLRMAGQREATDDLATTVVVVRGRLGAAADRIDRLPHRIAVAGEQLRAAGAAGPTVEAVTGQWDRAAERLAATAASLRGAVTALSPPAPAEGTGRPHRNERGRRSWPR